MSPTEQLQFWVLTSGYFASGFGLAVLAWRLR